MPNHASAEKLILASKSPRRRYLLENAGLVVEVIPSTVDEKGFSGANAREHVRKLAEAKARQVAQRHPDRWVLGADTIVLIDGRILGKPDSRRAARDMLQRLSGKTHQVLTGYCICRQYDQRMTSEVVSTGVRFKSLSKAEIEWYIHTEEPFDKAGAYAIQGLGTFLVKEIHGSYTNVVGLPVCEVIEYLIRSGVIGLHVGTNTHTPP
jgi:septum formation protein